MNGETIVETFTVGVDPGLTGAIAVLDSNGKLIVVHDMPVAERNKKREVSPQGLRLLENWAHGIYGTVVIEDVHTMPGQGVRSSGSIMDSKGTVRGFFGGVGRPIVYVAPFVWKRDLKLSKADKGASRQRAMELWPYAAAEFRRAKDDGRAEAALIALWWQRHG